MVEQYGDSIVQIKTFNAKGELVGTGTGFFIDYEGSLVTNHHVLERCAQALIKAEGGKKGKITRIIKDDSERDLLVAGTTFKKTLPIPFYPGEEIRIHDDIIYFATLGKVPNTISMGRVIDIISVEDFTIMKISAPILPGVSGSPVLNREGELIAIATAYLELDKGHFFAVPAEYLKDLKEVSLNLNMLPIRTTGLGATIQGRRLIGLGLYKFQQSSLTVYFKNGRHKQCDRAWMEGDTVFLVMQGKKFAIGYPKEEIDMQKSFGN